MNGLEKIRQALGGRKSTVNYGPHGETYLNIDGRSVEVAPTDTPADIKAKLQNPFENEKPKMSITGLKAGAFQGTIEALRQRLIDKQSQGAAKIAAAGEMGAAKIDEAVNSAEAKIDREVSEVLQDFSDFTNGGPA